MAATTVDAHVLQTALEQAPGHIIVTDAEMKIRYLNRVEHGYDADALIGMSYLDVLTPEQSTKVQAVLSLAKETGKPQQYETFVDSPTGGRQWYSTQITWYEAKDGSTGMISILTEVTQRKQAEQQAELLRKELVQASHRAGMAEIATGVLHNVGNVLNSVNVSADTVIKELDDSRLHLLGRTVQMLSDNEDRLATFISEDPKGRKLPALLSQLNDALVSERNALRHEANRLSEHLTLMRSIVEAQQAIAKLGEMVEPTDPRELVTQTMSMFQLDVQNRLVTLSTELPEMDPIVLDKQATLQVLANLIRNPIESLEDVELPRRLCVRLTADDAKIYFDVEDNGTGIAPEHHERLFEHGFSTKRNGHGFGLHASSIAARTMNGTLEAHSDGPGKGSRFRLTLPRISP